MEDETELNELFKLKRKLLAKNNSSELAKVCNRLGEILFSQGRLEEALDEHLEEEAACLAQNDVIGRAVACRKAGECHAALDDFDKALHYQYIHLKLAREMKCPVEEQRALATIGRTHIFIIEKLASRPGRKDVRDAGIAKTCNLAEKHFRQSLDICDMLPTSEVSLSEVVQMKGRLYQNLGLLMDHRSNLDSCVNFINKAITMHGEHGHWEDLERSHYALANIYLQHGDFENCLLHAESALEFAAKLKDIKSRYDALVLIGKASMERNNFSYAKQAFRKANKLDVGDNNKLDVEDSALSLLKCAAKLQQIKDSICMMASDDKESKMKAYEKMGDLCCKAKIYRRAVEFYGLVLRNAEQLKISKAELVPIYVSLAATYKDLQQFENAARYYRLEMECREENPEEKCRTLLNLADCEEGLGADYLVMEDMLKEALSLATLTGSRKLEKDCLEALAALQQSYGEDEKLRQTELALVPFSDIKTDASNEDNETSSNHSGTSSILLSDSADDSEDEAVDVQVNKPVQCPKTRKRFIVRKNEKGETQLHRACITGDLKLVKRLIEEGHPVNIRDYSGWLPIHEAANHDFSEIVKLLVEKGAWVNDRGGTHCGGITPLHDAAACGNFEIVWILLEHGASVLAKTDKNETVLDCLLGWRKRVQSIDPEVLEEFNRLEEDLRKRLEQRWMPSKNDDPSRSEKRREKKNWERRDSSEHLRSVDKVSLERRPRILTSLPSKETRDEAGPALVEEGEILPDCDNWLIDDMGDSRQRDSKRRRFDIRSWMEGTTNTRRSSSGVKRVASSSRLEVSGFAKEGRNIKERKRRRNCSNETVAQVYSEDAPSSPEASIPETQEQTVPEVQVLPLPVPPLRMTKVKVKILEKLFLIVVPQEETISWLAKEAAQRYFNETGLRPNLSLSTVEGALLSLDDTVDVVLSQNEEVMGTMQSWDLSSLSQRYVDLCKAHKKEPEGKILKILLNAETSRIASLDNLNLTPSTLLPVFRALQCQFNLRELNLSGNELGRLGLQNLSSALQRLPGLRVLDISLNDITDSELGELVKSLDNQKEVLKLERLNLGFNPLLDEGCSNLTSLLRRLPNLVHLSIPSISPGLSGDFPGPHLPEALKAIMKLERLDLSFTRLPFAQLDSLLATCLTESLLHLNLTGTVTDTSQAQKMCERLSELLRGQLRGLEELNLSLCLLDGECIAALLPGLETKRNLVHLDISGNAALTKASFDEVSKLIPASRLNLRSCPNISAVTETRDKSPPHSAKPTVSSSPTRNEDVFGMSDSDDDFFRQESLAF